MELKLQNESRLAEIKETFHRKFPFLKLEFFYPGTSETTRFTAQNRIEDHSVQIGEIAGLNHPGYVLINEYRSVADVEHCFSNCFGLYVQVFRKSGRCWLETTGTDHLSLGEQNRMGEEKEFRSEHEHILSDYHEQR